MTSRFPSIFPTKKQQSSSNQLIETTAERILRRNNVRLEEESKNLKAQLAESKRTRRLELDEINRNNEIKINEIIAKKESDTKEERILAAVSE